MQLQACQAAFLKLKRIQLKTTFPLIVLQNHYYNVIKTKTEQSIEKVANQEK